MESDAKSGLDETLTRDFAERIIKGIFGKPRDARFGMTHFIQFVRDSYQSQEEVTRYRAVLGRVVPHVQAAVKLLISEKKLEQITES